MNKKNKKSIFQKMLNTLNKILKVNKEHKEINKQHLEKSMSKREQRLWQIIALLVMIIVGGGIYIRLGPFTQEEQPDYALDFKIDPDYIWLNPDKDQEFKLTITNIGKKNISEFRVFDDVVLHRTEDKRVSWVRAKGYNDNYIFLTDNFQVGQKLTSTLTIDSTTAKRFFDDKEKHVQMFFYVRSIPPLKSYAIDIKIK